MITIPTTTTGKWSVGLNSFFLLAMITAITLVKILKLLDFGDHWWDVTVPITFSASIMALIIGMVAVKKYHDRSWLVYLSIGVGVCTILFIFTHSLFIND